MKMRLTRSFILLYLSFSLLSSCTSPSGSAEKEEDKEILFRSRDFTNAVFTEGIEGPAFRDGKLYVVNIMKEGTIGKVHEDGSSEVFLELPDGSTGNGIRFSKNGDMLVADYTGHNILRVNMGNKKISVFAHEELMNQPNDLAITDSDILFASDPDWKNGTGKLWRIGREGRVSLLEDNMGTTNGIEVSPRSRFLYVNESLQRKVWVYDLDSAGTIDNKRLFIEFPDFGLDGMRCDSEGNLYITRYGKGTVAIVSPEGILIREIKLKGIRPTNIAFGGKDGKTCFVTMQDRRLVEVFRTDVEGREFINQ